MTKLYLTICDKQRKNFFEEASSYLHGILSDIEESGISFS